MPLVVRKIVKEKKRNRKNEKKTSRSVFIAWVRANDSGVFGPGMIALVANETSAPTVPRAAVLMVSAPAVLMRAPITAKGVVMANVFQNVLC